jgi:uncharacterized protein (TIGR00661 family)
MATSFFKVDYAPINEYAVTIIPPIIGVDVKAQSPAPVDRQVTVYISAASQIQQSLDDLLAIFSQFGDYTFTCYINGVATRIPANVSLQPNTRAAFINSLCQSTAVIATAGHNLITEALYLHVPMFLLPFNHYEQRLNAGIITQEGIGYADSQITEGNLRAFLDNLTAYRQNRQKTERIYQQFDGDEVFLDWVETLEPPP